MLANRIDAWAVVSFQAMAPLFVIQPEEVDSFLLPLPVSRLPGVGKVMEEKLKSFEVQTVAELRKIELATLEGHFGRYGAQTEDRRLQNPHA